jgi:hypothetical protein
MASCKAHINSSRASRQLGAFQHESDFPWQILDVMAFIKARRPLGLRISQSLLNPGYAGMPANAQTVEWTFPPTCATSVQRWRAESR